jgi:aspartyl-tRNA(Asn)/glutamyl-tRNA(Gln) amidotransferase subunit C
VVERTARLARLDLDPRAAPELARQFERILAAFRGLAEVDVTGVAPLFTPLERHDVTREDRAQASLATEELLRNAPEPLEGFFGVPKTIGGEG